MMAKRRKRWWHPLQEIALIVAVLVLAILALMLMPVWGPLLARSMARDERRKRTLAETWPCGWCVAPLGEAALSRADALETAELQRISDELPGVRLRYERILHACCPRCGAAHKFNPKAQAFILLSPGEVSDRFGALLEETVAAPTWFMAWPWLRPATAMHQLQVSRDRIVSLGELVPPRPAEIELPHDVDVAAIAEALLRSARLPDLGPSVRWQCVAGAVPLEFGKEAGMPFVHRSDDIPRRADTVTHVHLAYAYDRNDHGQRDATH